MRIVSSVVVFVTEKGRKLFTWANLSCKRGGYSPRTHVTAATVCFLDEHAALCRCKQWASDDSLPAHSTADSTTGRSSPPNWSVWNAPAAYPSPAERHTTIASGTPNPSPQITPQPCRENETNQHYTNGNNNNNNNNNNNSLSQSIAQRRASRRNLFCFAIRPVWKTFQTITTFSSFFRSPPALVGRRARNGPACAHIVPRGRFCRFLRNEILHTLYALYSRLSSCDNGTKYIRICACVRVCAHLLRSVPMNYFCSSPRHKVVYIRYMLFRYLSPSNK